MDMDETVDRLVAGHDLQAHLAESARQSGEQVASDRHDVVGDIAAQNDELRGPRTPASNDQGQGPIAPHLVLASPAGIETSTAGTTHIASARHTALTSGGHTRIAAARSFFVSVKESIRLYARDAVIRLVAARQDIDIVALERNIAILAKLDIRMTADRISIRAQQRLELGGGTSYTSYTSAGITHMTPGAIVEHAGSRGLQGPMSVDQAHPLPSGSGPHDSADLIEEHFVLFEHAGGLRLPRQRYRIVFDGGRTVEGTTNDAGETEVVRSMVAQIATVDLLRHAEDGVLARHTPYVRMPAAQRHEREDGGGEAVAAEKRERRIAGTAHPANADQATSQGKAPVHTSCDPNNWGLRKSEPRAGDATRWDYPVADEFVKAIKPQLMAIDWKKATWPLGKADLLVLNKLFKATVESTLAKTAFALPVGAIPEIMILRDKEARELGMDPDDENLKGVMRLNDWWLVACKGGVTSMINVANKGTAEELSDCVRDFASTLFHEARHAQQFFWAAAMAQQFPQDYPTLPHLARYWRENLPPAIAQLAATTPVPDEPSARAGIHRMVVGMYYWQLTFVAQANQRRPHEPGYLSNILPTELSSARKAAHDLLQHVGLGGQPIDVDAMARGPSGGGGYRMRPWEEDSFVCDELVKRLWRGAADSLLPEPGFCTAALTHALAVRDGVTPGDTRRED
jgi:type VI secretion system secreted protein VgrG